MPGERYQKKQILSLPMTNPKLLLERIITAVGVLDDRWEDYQESITTGLIKLHTHLYQELNNRLGKLSVNLTKTYNGALVGSMAITKAISQAIESISSQINQSKYLLELINKSEFFDLLNDQLDDIAKSLSLRINEMSQGFNLALTPQPVELRVW